MWLAGLEGGGGLAAEEGAGPMVVEKANGKEGFVNGRAQGMQRLIFIERNYPAIARSDLYEEH